MSTALYRNSYALLRKLKSVPKYWYSTEYFSELHGLHPLVLEKLTQQNLLKTTDIQAKVQCSLCVMYQRHPNLCMIFPLLCYVF